MPYIKQDDRQAFDEEISSLLLNIDTVGELNYVISRLAKGIITKLGGRYEHHNAVIGVLECAKLEAYRRLTGPYEDLAIAKNGDIA